MYTPQNSNIIISAALNYIPADERETCLTVGMAIKSELGEAGYSIWDDWLQTGSNYNKKAMLSVWKSIKGQGVSIASLFYLARQHGYESKLKFERPPPRPTPKPPPDIKPNIKAGEFLRQVISDCQCFDKTPVIQYLENRGLSVSLPDDLFYLESCPDGHTHRPAMLAMIRAVDGEIISVHRTFLDNGHKASGTAKKLMSPLYPGTISGCAVRLSEGQKDALYLTEGIETGLAIRELFADKNPTVWACISASGLASVQIPPQYKMIYVMADKDKSETGEKSAKKLEQRLIEENKTVHIALPTETIPDDKKSIDWLDVLLNKKGNYHE